MQLERNIWLQDLHTNIERAALPTALDRLEYHLLDKTFNNKDVFDILTHHILKDMCEEIEATVLLGSKYILFQDESWHIEQSDYFPYSADVVKAVKRLENLIPKLVPVHLIKRPHNMHEFIHRCKCSYAEDLGELEKIKAKIDRNAFKSFNLNNVIKYLDRRGLKYMSTDYFQQANSKLLAANK